MPYLLQYVQATKEAIKLHRIEDIDFPGEIPYILIGFYYVSLIFEVLHDLHLFLIKCDQVL